MKKKKCIAMLLAGGQGTRLYALTSTVAKPAVSFGAKYRIIDFPLSNCTNSGIDTVGVLTQYQPLILNEYVGNGEPWDLDRTYGGVHTLPPYQAKTGGEWYKGTANAIYQNLHFLDEYDSEHVLILSGDHIYTMDYSKMLDEHIAHRADCTIAVIDVPKEEASRFGILDYDEKTHRIKSFEEKPKKPRSNHASMGIYIFRKEVLVKELIADENDPQSSNDFGKNIIPGMIAAGFGMYAYLFEGYWKDVGTVTSLWEANMDLLGENPLINLNETSFRIYSRNLALPPTYIGTGGKVLNSIMTAGCEINGKVVNSVLGEGVTVEKGAEIYDSVVMRGTRVRKGAVLRYGMIDENCDIGEDCRIGDETSDKYKIALVGRGNRLSAGTVVRPGEIVEQEANK